MALQAPAIALQRAQLPWPCPAGFCFELVFLTYLIYRAKHISIVDFYAKLYLFYTKNPTVS